MAIWDRMNAAAPADHVTLQGARPRLLQGVRQRRNDDDELVLLSAGGQHVMGVHPEEEPVVALIDGERSVENLVREGLSATPPVRAMVTLALLRRLQVGGLLEGLDAVEGHLLKGRASWSARLVRAWDVRMPLPGLGKLLIVGRPIGSRGVLALPWLALPMLIAGLVAAGVSGRWRELLSPLDGADLPAETLAAWLAAVAIFSWRGLWRGLSFAALDLPLPNATLRIIAPFVFADIDDKDRRAASREQRLRIASAGLSALALGAGLAMLTWLLLDVEDHRLRLLASVAFYLTLANAAPYGRGDGFHLVGILTGIPDLRRRSTAFLLRRSLRNLMRSEPVTPLEQTYLTVASAWLGHALLSLFLLTSYVLPGTLKAVAHAARIGADLGGSAGMVMAGLSLLILGLAVVLLIGVGMVVGGATKQLMRRPKSTPPRQSQRVGADAESLTTELAKVPFLGALPREELATVASGMCREQHDADAAIVRQGESGNRFFFLHSGEADVIYEEESGLQHRVARLTPGDFFGEIALLEAVPRTATVIARGDCEVLTLDRETFVALVERSRFARDAILDQVRNAAFLRQVRVFSHLGAKLMALLLEGITVERIGPKQTIVREGDDGDAMYVLREGRCQVERATDLAHQLAVGELKPGDWFGEIAVLRGVERTATVRTMEGCTLIRVPAEVLDSLLMEDLATGLALEQTVASRLVALEAH